MTHDDTIKRALISLDVSPDFVARHYIQAVLEEEDFNVSAAARRMFMHRRTLQRILRKDIPPAKPAVPESRQP